MTTFVLGLGAQKAGTTWLHRQISENPNVNMGFVKEYHVLDVLTIPHMFGMLRKRLDSLPALPANADREAVLAHARRREFKWLGFYTDPEAYYDYFARLLREDGIDLTGDITPSYSGLSAETLATVQRAFRDRGITVKCVFLMRDPVERLWSAVRMQRRLKLDQKPDHVFPQSEEKAVLRAMNTADARLRGTYQDTIRNIEAVFRPEDRFVCLYETLLDSPAEWARLKATVGVDLKDPDYAFKHNVSKKSAPISRDTMEQVAQTYADTYTFIRAHFPDMEIDRHWPSASLDPVRQAG
ncbi:hypothetical protein [Marinibacterium sp. SX1]|uniref:hypothetical protein n=1 Tax=Marinibacterium sp. SX1 TaxID=3388424 RepID=UPI003D17DA1C